MAHRNFNGIQYPVPGVDTAIYTLRPGAIWQMYNTEIISWEDPEGRNPPTWQEIEQEVSREMEIYEYYAYERSREQQYPTIAEQLDMLYHDLKANNLNNGTWITTIEKVKNDNPKPEHPSPKI